MEAYTYELLVERGWRRCGNYYYKPNLLKSCCKSFTHRLEVRRYRPKKDQRKAVKKAVSLFYEKVEVPKGEGKHQPKPEQAHKSKAKHEGKVQPAELSEFLKGELTKVCARLTAILQERLPVTLNHLNLMEGTMKGFTWPVGEKLRFFKSKPG